MKRHKWDNLRRLSPSSTGLQILRCLNEGHGEEEVEVGPLTQHPGVVTDSVHCNTEYSSYKWTLLVLIVSGRCIMSWS